MNCVIIEDNKVQQHIISQYVESTSQLKLVGVYSNVVDIMTKLNNFLNVDVLFLDVELPLMTGIEFLEKYKPNVRVILITSHKSYALDAFNNDVIDYLVKPVQYPRFLHSLNKLKDFEKGKDTICIKSSGKMIKLSCNDILWVKSANEYLIIYTPNDKFIIYSTMQQLIDRLPNFFMRVHRSHIVNTRKIESFFKSHLFILIKSK